MNAGERGNCMLIRVSGSCMISTRQVIRSKPAGMSTEVVLADYLYAERGAPCPDAQPRRPHRAVSAAARRLGKTRSFTEIAAGLLNHRRP